MHLRPRLQRGTDVVDDAALRQKEAPVGLVYGGDVVVEVVPCEPPADLRSRQDLVGDVVLLAGGHRALEVLVLGVPRSYGAGGHQQTLAGGILQLVPQLVGAPDQRDIRGMLLQRVPDHPGVAVRRPHLVGNIELLQAQNAPASAGQVV